MQMPYLALQPLADLPLLCPVKGEQLTQEILPGITGDQLYTFLLTLPSGEPIMS
jgi:hypothetical protein